MVSLSDNSHDSIITCRGDECYSPEFAHRYSYKLNDTVAPYGLDVIVSEEPEFDESKMSLIIAFADGNVRDGVGDLLEVGGIKLDRHRLNPICLYDHGKNITLPIAMSQSDPSDNSTYSVSLCPITQKAKANAFFYSGKGGLKGVTRDREYDHAVFCEQLYDLAVKRFIRGGSIGYQVIHAKHLDPDYTTGTPQGLHLLQVLMLELSLVVMPANQETVRKCLSQNRCCGKPLSPYLIKSLTPFVGANSKVVSGYEGKSTKVPLGNLPKTKIPPSKWVPGAGAVAHKDHKDQHKCACEDKHKCKCENSEVGEIGEKGTKAQQPVGGPPLTGPVDQKDTPPTPRGPNPNQPNTPYNDPFGQTKTTPAQRALNDLLENVNSVLNAVKTQSDFSRDPAQNQVYARLELIGAAIDQAGKDNNFLEVAKNGRDFFKAVEYSRVADYLRASGGKTEGVPDLLELRRAVRACEILSGHAQVEEYTKRDKDVEDRMAPSTGVKGGVIPPTPPRPAPKTPPTSEETTPIQATAPEQVKTQTTPTQPTPKRGRGRPKKIAPTSQPTPNTPTTQRIQPTPPQVKPAATPTPPAPPVEHDEPDPAAPVQWGYEGQADGPITWGDVHSYWDKNTTPQDIAVKYNITVEKAIELLRAAGKIAISISANRAFDDSNRRLGTKLPHGATKYNLKSLSTQVKRHPGAKPPMGEGGHTPAPIKPPLSPKPQAKEGPPPEAELIKPQSIKPKKRIQPKPPVVKPKPIKPIEPSSPNISDMRELHTPEGDVVESEPEGDVAEGYTSGENPIQDEMLEREAYEFGEPPDWRGNTGFDNDAWEEFNSSLKTIVQSAKSPAEVLYKIAEVPLQESSEISAQSYIDEVANPSDMDRQWHINKLTKGVQRDAAEALKLVKNPDLEGTTDLGTLLRIIARDLKVIQLLKESSTGQKSLSIKTKQQGMREDELKYRSVMLGDSPFQSLRPKTKILKKEGGEYVLYSHQGRVLGKHPSREAAVKQEQAIEISKHKSLREKYSTKAKIITHDSTGRWRRVSDKKPLITKPATKKPLRPKKKGLEVKVKSLGSSPKSISDLRSKHRHGTKRKRLLRRGTPSQSVLWTHNKDLSKIKDECTKYKITLNRLGAQDELDKIKLTGPDEHITEIARVFGRSAKTKK